MNEETLMDRMYCFAVNNFVKSCHLIKENQIESAHWMKGDNL